MSALARAVGISRQALYLHFPDRTQLMLTLVAHVDEKEQLPAGIAAVTQAADAAGAIRAWARMQTWHNPNIAPLARAQDETRHADPCASAAWADRMAGRMRGAVSIIERLRAHGLITWKDLSGNCGSGFVMLQQGSPTGVLLMEGS